MVLPGIFATAATLPKPRLHFIQRLNAMFTLRKNSEIKQFLRGRINCAEIVAP